MAVTKPVGFDNFRVIWNISKDGSGNKTWIKASFINITTEEIEYYRGANIASTVAGTPTTINTDEPHGLETGDTIRIDGCRIAALNGVFTVTKIDADTFTVSVSTSSGSTNSGIAGVKVPGYHPKTETADIIVGRKFVEDYPEAWELPLEG